MKRTLLSLIALGLGILAAAQGNRIVCDETCRIEYQKTGTEQPEQAAAPKTEGKKAAAKPAPKTAAKAQPASVPGYAVVSPVGRTSVEMITQAPRLETLDGKTVAVVGVSFMTGVTHPEIKRLILSHYPTAEVLLLDEIGFSGPFPAPGVTRKQHEEFKQKLRDMHVDAVISGNGGCGLCTPKETGSCITAEHLGIPSVVIAGPGFSDQARYTARNNGVPVMRVAEYPGAFAADSEELLLKNTREILWPQIVDALTKPISAEEIAQAEKAGNGDIRDDVFYGTLEEVDAYFRKQNWTDGLPIVPPTFDKVTEFMRYTPYSYDETVAVLPVAHRDTKAWHVAVNAVMAGCLPEYMPILIALTKGLGDGNFRRTLASTHAWAPYCWINGPIARELGIDCGQGQINEEANMAIGRFMNLALMNLCAGRLGAVPRAQRLFRRGQRRHAGLHPHLGQQHGPLHDRSAEGHGTARLGHFRALPVRPGEREAIHFQDHPDDGAGRRHPGGEIPHPRNPGEGAHRRLPPAAQGARLRQLLRQSRQPERRRGAQPAAILRPPR